ncbi:MAG: LytR/AlgR family response regulator transcription factor [Candidatus Cyclobacteriaceae bacterium M2_1C_046]
MKILIVEDEKPAADKLQRFIKRYDPSYEVSAICDSIKTAVPVIKGSHDSIDLIFMDIQLKDGKSFEILNYTSIKKPVIFTTAYDDYAIEAFKLNSIAYLLKPYTYEEVAEALNKLLQMKEELKAEFNTDILKSALNQLSKKKYKDRFMVKLGDHLKSIPINEIAYFFADGRTVYLITRENRRFIIDFNLEELVELLDPALFFRANRTFILNIETITDVAVYSNSRLKISVTPNINKEIIVSRERVADFKNWFSGY